LLGINKNIEVVESFEQILNYCNFWMLTVRYIYN